jgi:hypothetical protein
VSGKLSVKGRGSVYDRMFALWSIFRSFSLSGLILSVNNPENAPYSQRCMHACMVARSRPQSVSRFITRKRYLSRRRNEEAA